MAPKSFVLDLILTPHNQYPVLGGVRDVTSSRIANEQNQTESAVFQLCSFTVFPKVPFFKLFSLFYSLHETPNSCLLQGLRLNGVGRIFERVNIMQENNWLIRLNKNNVTFKESLHNQKLHRVI